MQGGRGTREKAAKKKEERDRYREKILTRNKMKFCELKRQQRSKQASNQERKKRGGLYMESAQLGRCSPVKNHEPTKG